MSWQQTSNIIIRGLIGDIDSPQTYTDDRLTYIALNSAHLLLNEVSFNSDYSVDVQASSISPDPITDTNFINLLALRSAVLISNSEYKTAAKQSFIVKDGPSSLDTSTKYRALEAFAATANQAYLKAKLDYVAGNSTGSCAIMTPFYSRSYPANMLYSGDSYPNQNSI